MPEVVEVLAYARAVARPDRERGAGADPARRRGTGSASRTSPCVARLATREDQEPARRLRPRTTIEASRSCSPRRSSTSTRSRACPTKGASGWPGSARSCAALRVEARRPVGEFLGEVIRRIGILDELDADLDRRRGLGARRNLAAFLDEVHAFQPVEGELTLRAFLDYIDAVEGLDKQEWAPVQPSRRGLGQGHDDPRGEGAGVRPRLRARCRARLLPNPKVPQNPAERGKSLDSSCGATRTSCRATRATCRCSAIPRLRQLLPILCPPLRSEKAATSCSRI